jgi:hypothetical protein
MTVFYPPSFLDFDVPEAKVTGFVFTLLRTRTIRGSQAQQ